MFGLGVFCPRLTFAFCQGVGPSYSGSKKTLRCADWNANWIWKRTVSLKLCACTVESCEHKQKEMRTLKLIRKLKTHRIIKLLCVYCGVFGEHKHNTAVACTVEFTQQNWPTKQSHKTLRFLQRLPFLPLNNRAEMSSIFINALSSSSSMNQTYPVPSCNKPSKAPLKHGNCNPTRNKRTHPFVLRSSLHSLRVGRRCHQTLHSRVLFCLPFHTLLPNWCVVMVILFSISVWSYTLWFYLWLFVCGFVFGCLCVVFVFFITLVYMWVYFGCGHNFGCFSSCLCCIPTIYICVCVCVSLFCMFHLSLPN